MRSCRGDWLVSRGRDDLVGGADRVGLLAAGAPWDRPIRYRLGLSENDAAYRSYLHLVARGLARTAERAGVAVEELPALVGRPESSPPELIDEYLWMRVTRGSATAR